MFTEPFIVLFLLRRSTSSTTQSVQSSTASSWTNTSDEEKLSPLTSHPLSCITHKIVTFSCAHSFLVKKLPTHAFNTCRVTSHGHGFTYLATPPYMSMSRCCGITFGVATVHSDIAFGRSGYSHPGTRSTYQHYSLAHSAYCLVPKPPTVRSHPTHKSPDDGKT